MIFTFSWTAKSTLINTSALSISKTNCHPIDSNSFDIVYKNFFSKIELIFLSKSLFNNKKKFKFEVKSGLVEWNGSYIVTTL